VSVKYAREATAAVLIPAVLAVLIFGPTWGFSLLAGAAAAVALLEFYGLIESAGWVVPRWVGLAGLFALLFAADRASLSLFLAVAGGILLALPTLVMFAGPPERVLLPSSAASVFATLYVAA